MRSPENVPLDYFGDSMRNPPDKGWLTCGDCGKRKPDVRETHCPYADEIHETIVEITACDDCLADRAGDI